VYIWDPKAGKIRTWVIASDGSWSQADVEVLSDRIQLKTSGVTAGGLPILLTSTLTLPTVAKDTKTEEWSGTTVSGQPQPNPPVIVWHRKVSPAVNAAPRVSSPVSSLPPLPEKPWSVINLPLARTADDYASMGHARALIYKDVREARAASPQPHRN